MTKRQQMQRQTTEPTSFEYAVFACQQLNLQEKLAILKWLGFEVGVPLYTQEDVNKITKPEKRSPILSLKDT